jgi:hypothetical protein
MTFPSSCASAIGAFWPVMAAATWATFAAAFATSESAASGPVLLRPHAMASPAMPTMIAAAPRATG